MSDTVRVSCRDGVLHEPQRVLAAALQAYIAIDPAGLIAGWNPAAEATFGFTQAQACGRDVGDLIIPQRYRDAHRAGLARLAAGEPGRVLGQRLQLTAVHRDGCEFPIEMTLTATQEPSGWMFHALVQDITAAQRASRFAEVETAVARGLAEAASSAAAAARVVEALGVKMDWRVVELWLVDDDRQLLTCAARYAEPGRRLDGFAVDELEAGVGLPGRVCQQGRPHWIADLGADAHSLRGPAAARAGLRVAVGVPLCTGRHTSGALCVYGDRVEDPQDTLTALLGGIAAQLGQYLERRRAEELAVELARTKDEFLAMVTHELRNPLSVITSTAALFGDELEELSTDQQRHYLQVITRSAQRLSVMAEDLLDLARLESGHLAIDPGRHRPVRDHRPVGAGTDRAVHCQGPHRERATAAAPAVTRRPGPAAASRRQPAVQRDQIHPGRRHHHHHRRPHARNDHLDGVRHRHRHPRR
ncbi:histidine kinase dimerization/phospho-acceptor domain-containing protein [Actinoplanes sp. NPDC051346]|uniref:histidine kinase dimerization/phospho-acceptor domain-containing protein n=1 Tax=Actinoplanes sp. NPDC051346 TaxID=3155048 RepID=UPI00343B136A